jgi:hypothetical protein
LFSPDLEELGDVEEDGEDGDSADEEAEGSLRQEFVRPEKV